MEEVIQNITNSIINTIGISEEDLKRNCEFYLKKYLNRIEFNHYDCKMIDKEIVKIQRDIDILNANAMYQSPQFGERVDHSISSESKIEVAMVQIESLKKELQERVVEKYLILKSLEEQTNEIIKLFELTIPNEMHRRIMREIYIDCYKPQMVADNHFIALPTVRSIMIRSIKKMSQKLKCIKMQQ